MLYDAGAKEVHMAIASPAIKFPDFYGVDTPTQDELLAANKNQEEIIVDWRKVTYIFIYQRSL